MAHEAAVLSVGVCNVFIDNSSVADSPDGAIREMLRYAVPALSRVRSKSEQLTVMPAARRYPGISGP